MNSRLQTSLDKKTVLLFYKEYEADKFIKYDRYLKRIVRPFYNALHHRQKKTGFAVSFELMRRALTDAGYHVVVNHYPTARTNPAYSVGLVGFPLLLDNWTLPNPAVLGPSLCDHPMLTLTLFDNPRYKKYAVLAWDRSIWADTLLKRLGGEPLAASYIPFFSATYRKKFKRTEYFESAFDRFIGKLGTYKPRDYVAQELSYSMPAAIYVEQYFSIFGAA
jgi:hypothetical protein